MDSVDGEILEILNTVHPEMTIESKCLSQLKEFAFFLFEKAKGPDLSLLFNNKMNTASLLKEILELAGNAARDSRKSREITIKDVYLILYYNYSNILELFRVIFEGSGVIPNIRQEFLPEEGSKPNPKMVEGLRKVRRSMKESGLILPSEDFKDSKLQAFIEQYTIQLLNKSADICIYSGRNVVIEKDVKMAWRLCFPQIVSSYNQKVTYIGGDIKELGYRAGIPVLEANNEVRLFISTLLSLTKSNAKNIELTTGVKFI